MINNDKTFVFTIFLFLRPNRIFLLLEDFLSLREIEKKRYHAFQFYVKDLFKTLKVFFSTETETKLRRKNVGNRNKVV